MKRTEVSDQALRAVLDERAGDAVVLAKDVATTTGGTWMVVLEPLGGHAR